MTDLVPCPLCGGSEGYSLSKTSDYRYFGTICKSCGEKVAECCADEFRHDDHPPKCRTANGDWVWNAAGAYADKLRRERDEARADIERLSVDLAEARRVAQ